MKCLSSFFLSSVLHRRIYDEFQDCIGKLWDIYVTTEEGYPRVIGYKVKKDREIFNYEFKNIEFVEENNRVIINVKGAREIIPRTYNYLLSKHLLDKKIVDVDGKKLVKVNDLRMAIIAGELRVIAVDSGTLAMSRRRGMESLVKSLYKMFNKKPLNSIIMWDSVQSLEMVDDSLKLQVPYKKLTELHPADLADILEEMDTRYRNKIFESLDENFAADTLEEIEPEIQANIIRNISESKAVEVLDNMPSDEIADLLDEVDKETAEKLLMQLEEKDADEVRTLMGYSDEIVGSIMNKDFISFNVDITAEETIDLLRQSKPEDEVSYYIYIVDEYETVKGWISLRDLIVADPKSKLKDIMNVNVIVIKDSEKIEKAIECAVKYDLYSLPVINSEDKLCGIVVMNDIVDEMLLPAWKKKIKRVV